MTDQRKAEALAYLASEMGIQVTPESLSGILANFNNFQDLHRCLTNGFPHDLPLDSDGNSRP